MSALRSGLPEELKRLLQRNGVGPFGGMSCLYLAGQLGTSEREIRKAITALRLAGEPVGGHPRSGYYWATTPAELARTCEFLRSRALKSLRLEARLRNVPLAELMGQVQLELEAQP